MYKKSTHLPATFVEYLFRGFRFQAGFLFVICYNISAGQIAGGTYTIPGSYATVAAAVTALNTAGISGAVTFNCAAGGSETAPTDGIKLGSTALNATTSASNTITFETSGPGADYEITAAAGTGTYDFIVALLGTDYVTINGIDLLDPSGNNSPTTEMEYGYAFFLLNSAGTLDGCQFDSIENCTITLHNTNTNIANVNGTEGSSGIFAEEAYNTNPTIALTPGSIGVFRNNTFCGNTIQDCSYGIYLVGDAELVDQNNTIGGNSTATGNTIQNLAVPGGANPLYGVFAMNQDNIYVIYNNINNTAGGGLPAAGLAIGVDVSGNNGEFWVNSNIISLTLTEAVVSGEPYSDGIYVPSTGDLVADANTITMVENKDTYPGFIGPLSGVMNGILTYTAGDTITSFSASGNNINILQMDTAPVYGFNVAASSGGGAVIIDNTVTEKCAYTTNVSYTVVLGNHDTTYAQILTPTLYGIGVFSAGETTLIRGNSVVLYDSTYAYAYGIYTGTTAQPLLAPTA